MMMLASFISKILGGGDPADGAGIEHLTIRFGQENWILWLIPITLTAAALSWLAYRRSPVAMRVSRKLMLSGLRALFLILLGLAFLQPSIRISESQTVRRSLPIAVDKSQSFGIRDIGSDKTRVEIGQQVLKDLTVSLGSELELPTYQFGGEVTALNSDTPIDADAPSTAIGDTIDSILAGHAGQPLAGIVLLTDGNSNHGRGLGQGVKGDVPLYIVGIGATATVDASIRLLDAPPTVLAGDRVPVVVMLETQGLEGETGEVSLMQDGIEVARRQIDFTGGEQSVPLEFLPVRTGAFDLEARVETPRQEVLTGNNSIRERIDVIDSSIRVLMVEQAPRWEFNYLQAMLLREPRVQLKCVLFEADAEATRESGSPYLEAFPSRADLFDYDLVILGDVDPDILTDAYQRLLIEYVSRAGGALVIVAGKRFMPSRYRYSSIKSLLPIGIASSELDARVASDPLRMRPLGDDPMLILADDPGENASVWEALPPIFWKASVAGVKPGATVLAETDAGDPLAVLQPYGSGEVFFLGTDNAWRWRRHGGDRLHTRFWGQIIQRLAGSRLVERSRRASVQTDKRRYRPGEQISIQATLRSADWQPLTQETVIANFRSGDGSEREIALRAVPGQPGDFQANAIADQPGTVQISIPEAREIRPVDLSIAGDNRELQALTVDIDRLQHLAESSGGRFFTVKDVADLPAAIQNRSATINRTRDAALWASLLFFIILLVPLTAEWILRKFSELK